MKKRFTEEQIVKILEEAERHDGPVRDIVRQYNITEQTFYRWRKVYGGMPVSEVKRMKELDKENAKLKKLLAEQMLLNEGLKELLEKKW